MYRIVFISTDPRTRMQVFENGPWLSSKAAAEKWMEYFDNVGVLAKMKIEAASFRKPF